MQMGVKSLFKLWEILLLDRYNKSLTTLKTRLTKLSPAPKVTQ